MQANSKRNLYLILSSAAMALPASNTIAQEKPTAKLDEVTVTARRREESAQETPVSVSVISAEELYKSGIKEIRDLTATVPGVNMTSSGGTNNTVFSIRGRSRSVVGNAQPSVATYVNEVPLSIWGASIPTYDISSIQVLKGPQGTLFGRNTTTGAVLVSTAQPTHNFEGFVQATIGDYRWQQYEGAVNLPILKDKVALRVSGQMADRDGYTENMVNRDLDYDDMDRDNYRLSLLIEPFDSLKNVTVYESNKSNEVGAGVVFSKYTPGQAVDNVPFYNGQFRTFNPAPVLCNGDPVCDIGALAERQKQAGPRKVWGSVNPFQEGELTSWSNTTTLELGSVTLKNIFGYREVFFHQQTDIDGMDMSMIDSDNLVDNKQTTNEFQISGNLFNESLNYIAGYFWSEGEPDGPQRLIIQQFAVSGTPISAPPGTNPLNPSNAPFNGGYGRGEYYKDTSNAYFAQVNYKFTPALSIDAGVRHTKDEQEVCATNITHFLAAPITEGECKSGAGTFSDTDSSKTTYTLGLNYQITDDMLLYAVTRTGYRAGGINTPVLGGTLTPFQNYDAEEVQDYEVGLKSDWTIADMAGRFNIALFQSDFEDVQAGLPILITGPQNPAGPDGDFNGANDPSNNTFYANAGDASVQGVEVETMLAPTDALELSFGGAYLDKELDKLAPNIPVGADFIEGITFIGSPDYSYNLGATYTLPLADLGDLRFSAKYFRIGDIEYGSVEAPGYERTDLRVDWLNVVQSGVDVAAFVTNVFDKDAIIAPGLSSEGVGANSAIYNEPRIMGVQVRYQFGNK